MLVIISVRQIRHLPKRWLYDAKLSTHSIGRKPTSSSSEASVSMAEGTMPWQTSSAGGKSDEHFKYQYHPGGDKSKAPKNAPSALHSVIVPNVTLPKVSTSFAKQCIAGFCSGLTACSIRSYMTNTTNGVKKVTHKAPLCTGHITGPMMGGFAAFDCI